MTPLELTEDRIPLLGIEETIAELVDLYGGEMKGERANERDFVLPLRRGVAVSGGVECTVSWDEETTVKLVCNREVDAPKAQRVALLLAGVVGALLFTLWPFFAGHANQLGTLAWIGGFVALAVYFLTLKRTSGGIASDFLQRLAQRQRARETA
ncbi:MAG TPA: hypothetical protein VG323_11040 [Thermoanaerobaculia bacterium]|nr:hypothetical protein [Thermoanaerobaculia bacterium]